MKCLKEFDEDDYYNWGGEVDASELNNNKMTKEDAKRHLVSAGITFGSTFLVTLAMAIVDSSFSFSREALVALAFSAIIAGVRGVAKLVLEWNGLSL